jgi:hypothetical protein
LSRLSSPPCQDIVCARYGVRLRSPAKICGFLKEEFMAEKAGARPYTAPTNPSSNRCPAYPCNWVLYDRAKGEVMITKGDS